MTPTAQVFFDKSVVLFDLDGTLVDSVPDIAQSVNHMLTKLDHAALAEDQIRDYVGNGVQRLIERALTKKMDAKPEAEEFIRAHNLFSQFYTAHICDKSVLYSGCREMLEQLQKNNFTLACVTNKPRLFTQPLLQALSIDTFFQLILSGDTLEKKKPDPEPLYYAVTELGSSIKNAVLVGDSVNDVAAAKAAGMSCVAVSFGYNHGVDIGKSKPDVVIDELAALPALLGC